MYTRGTIHKAEYNIYRNRLTSLLRRARRLYYFKIFLQDKGNHSRTWSHINHLLGRGIKKGIGGAKRRRNFVEGAGNGKLC